jgi:hypothetical protein
MQEVVILKAKFIKAFGRDMNHSTIPAYLDLKTGGILSDGSPHTEELVKASPDRYLYIPGLSHDTHHKILQEFLGSNWTDDKGSKKTARKTYSGSIGDWIRNVDEITVNKYRDFCEARTEQMAEEFLRERGIHPRWKDKTRMDKAIPEPKKNKFEKRYCGKGSK